MIGYVSLPVKPHVYSNQTPTQEHAALQGVSEVDFMRSGMERAVQRSIKRMAGDALLAQEFVRVNIISTYFVSWGVTILLYHVFIAGTPIAETGCPRFSVPVCVAAFITLLANWNPSGATDL